MPTPPGPEWLNYHHLLYFWMTVKEGGVTQAARRLHVSQPTVSGQIHALERRVGESLLVRRGRGVVPTEIGRTVFEQAQAVFEAGGHLVDILHGRAGASSRRLVVGIVDALPKLVAHRILEGALRLPGPVTIVAREGAGERLLHQLVAGELDLVLSDEPVRLPAGVRAFHHLLGESGVTFFGTRELTRGFGPRAKFPGVLEAAPLLLPGEGSSLRRSLDSWLLEHALRPRIVGEFDDLALMKAFGEAGAGFFAAPSAVEDEVVRQHRVEVVGRTDEVKERVYAISLDRRLRHPAVVAICEGARKELFGGK